VTKHFNINIAYS